jgi:hypothetical protein
VSPSLARQSRKPTSTASGSILAPRDANQRHQQNDGDEIPLYIHQHGGRTFTSPEEGKSLPIGDSYHVEHTVFSKVDFSDEFPKTCKFVEVQVCPAYPAKLAKPTAAGVPAYYKPFHDGEPAEGCRNAVNLDAVDLPVPDGPKGCMAVVHGRVYNKQLYDEYGYFKRGYWANGAKTQDEGYSKRQQKLKLMGFTLMMAVNLTLSTATTLTAQW